MSTIQLFIEYIFITTNYMPDTEVDAGVLHEQNIFCLYHFGTYSLVGRDRQQKIHRKLIKNRTIQTVKCIMKEIKR